MSVERFKIVRRGRLDWPDLDGYVLLFVVRFEADDRAYYCTQLEARYLCDALSPHIEKIEFLLLAGETFETVVAQLLEESGRKAVDGDI